MRAVVLSRAFSSSPSPSSPITLPHPPFTLLRYDNDRLTPAEKLASLGAEPAEGATKTTRGEEHGSIEKLTPDGTSEGPPAIASQAEVVTSKYVPLSLSHTYTHTRAHIRAYFERTTEYPRMRVLSIFPLREHSPNIIYLFLFLSLSLSHCTPSERLIDC